MSKFVLGEVIMVRNELNKIVEKSVQDKLPAFLAFKFAKLFKEIDNHFADFDKQRMELVKQFGKPDPDNEGAMIVEKENLPAFTEQMNKLLATELEYTPSVSFKYSDFDSTKIDVVEASALLPFIKDEE